MKTTERKTGGRSILRVTLLSLAAFLVLFSAASMVVVKNVYDQEFPRFEKPEFTGYIRYSDVPKYERTVIQFKSGQNTLTGFIYGSNNNKGLVVISPGLGYGAESYLAETLYFVDHGWRVFSYDSTGSYESEGKSTVGLPQSVLDLDAALSYIEKDDTLTKLPKMLFGHSWGAFAVTAILNYPHKVNAAVSLAGFNSPVKMMHEGLKAKIGFLAYVEYPFAWAYQVMRFGRAARLTAVSEINKADTAVMVIHGDQDEKISYTSESIISHRNDITNPKVVYRTRSAAGRNGHNNLLRSEAAAEYAKTKNQEYKPIFDSYKGQVPDEIKAKYYAGVDVFKTSELDATLMNEVDRFFQDNL